MTVPADPRARYARWVAPLCWTAVALEGFDLVVLGVVLPALLKDKSWGLDPNTASLISVVGLLGVAVGAFSIGPLSDLFGRRGMMLLTVTSFSILTLLCAFANGPWLFGVLRFLAGLGLGGVLPTALALITEYARVGRGGSATTVLMTGYHVGAVLTALLGILVVQRFGWEWMFVIGAAPALILVPLMVKFLPESAALLQARGTPAAPRPARERNPLAILFRHGYGRATIAFWVTSFMGLLLVYGLNTWLPQIMREAGYELGAALALLLVLNVGAVIGLLIGGRVADRIGYRRSTITWFVAAAVFLALLSIKLPGVSVYAGVLLAGIFTFSSQVLVYVYIARVYPAEARGTGLGAASGIGRFGAMSGPLVTGFLLSAGLAYPWGFYLFAVVAAIGAAAIAVVNRDPSPDAPADNPAPHSVPAPGGEA
ncbi:MFS transporter [Amycolatopsis jejuensis]|uniref:MFS transporter n=1 Tax=Amycolatopsis jejuensis TaxID=330084 RepID=UPI00068E7272|nr:aromatic acid/H+ symport family MFS transporter [Amycolatopsis jejuensis]